MIQASAHHESSSYDPLTQSSPFDVSVDDGDGVGDVDEAAEEEDDGEGCDGCGGLYG